MGLQKNKRGIETPLILFLRSKHHIGDLLIINYCLLQRYLCFPLSNVENVSILVESIARFGFDDPLHYSDRCA